MKTAIISVYGNIARSVLKIEFTPRCVEYICSVSSPLKTPQALTFRALNREDTDKCTHFYEYSRRMNNHSMDSIFWAVLNCVRPKYNVVHNDITNSSCHT